MNAIRLGITDYVNATCIFGIRLDLLDRLRSGAEVSPRARYACGTAGWSQPYETGDDWVGHTGTWVWKTAIEKTQHTRVSTQEAYSRAHACKD